MGTGLVVRPWFGCASYATLGLDDALDNELGARWVRSRTRKEYTAYLTSSKLCFRSKDVLCKKTWLYNVFAYVVCVCGAETGCVNTQPG
jgi:hypothetical protein